MLPNSKQYAKWSLISKWGFWSALIGIPASLLSIWFTFWPLKTDDGELRQRSQFVFQTAQDLRGNREYLCDLYTAYGKGSKEYPPGHLKTEALAQLVLRDHEKVIESSYGEEKYIYQLSQQLGDIGTALGSPKSSRDVRRFLSTSVMTLHDIAFLNDFLNRYLHPLISERLTERQQSSLGWNGIPGKQFHLCNEQAIDMKYFLLDGVPIKEFVDYLGLID